MNAKHLSDWEIEELIIHSPQGQYQGEADDPAWQHVSECERCMSSKERLSEALLLYRDAALLQTNLWWDGCDDSLPGSAVRADRTHEDTVQSSWRGPWSWALALLMLLALSVSFFIRQQRERHDAEIARDNLLLEQVDQEVTESVPDPLRSLTNLVVAGENVQSIDDGGVDGNR